MEGKKLKIKLVKMDADFNILRYIEEAFFENKRYRSYIAKCYKDIGNEIKEYLSNEKDFSNVLKIIESSNPYEIFDNYLVDADLINQFIDSFIENLIFSISNRKIDILLDKKYLKNIFEARNIYSLLILNSYMEETKILDCIKNSCSVLNIKQETFIDDMKDNMSSVKNISFNMERLFKLMVDDLSDDLTKDLYEFIANVNQRLIYHGFLHKVSNVHYIRSNRSRMIVFSVKE